MQRSDAINELATALAKTQGLLKSATKDSTNPFYKSSYADLTSVWEACRKPLSDNGLSVVQTLDIKEGASVLETTLLHSSGQFITSFLSITPKEQTPQAIGSAITYARRYALSALIGIVADEDDDAEGAMARKDVAIPKYTKPPQKDTKPSQPILPKVAPQPTPTQAPPEESPKQFRQTAPPIVEPAKPEKAEKSLFVTKEAKDYIPTNQGALIWGAKHFFNKGTQDIAAVIMAIPATTGELQEAWGKLVKAWSTT